MFDHFILTRYNHGLYSNDKIKDKKGWMDRRLELFSKCSESVVNQRCGNFRWIISIDPKTPNRYFKKISSMTNYNSIITTREVRDFMKVNVDIMSKKEWVITTRLDNDDILDKDFVKVVQDEFKGVEEVIDVRGWHYDGQRKVESVRRRANSPFLSLVENRKGMETCLCHPHTDMPDYFDSRLIDKRLYTQVIHDDCLMNKMPI